jgi:hypothetical protein
VWSADRAQVTRAYLAFGFTSVIDLDASPADRAWFEATPSYPHFHDNAVAFGLSHEVGSIDVRKRADLLLLKENPLVSVAAYDSIETIFLDGVAIDRETLRAHD